jgi:glycosyltransferase involved in cell wall biosynthesis
MKIGINGVFFGDSINGMANYTLQLFNELVKQSEDEFVIFLTCEGGIGKFLDSRIQQVYLRRNVRSNHLKLVLEQLFLPHYLIKHGVDVLFCPAYTLPLLSRIPSVVVAHDMIYQIRNDGGKLLSHFHRKFFYTASILRADRIITISEASKSDFLRYFPEKRNIQVTLLGTIKYPMEKQRMPVCMTDDRPYLLMVGSPVPRKNSLRTIQALQSIEYRKDLKLVIVGGQGRGTEEVLAYIQDNALEDRVILTGDLSPEELAWSYGHGEILVFPSLHEGFGLPLLEAMAVGMPVIGAISTSIPEVVGEAGVLVDPYSVEAIAQAIESILKDKDLREELVRKGYERVKDFSWQRTAEETMGIIKAMVD